MRKERQEITMEDVTCEQYYFFCLEREKEGGKRDKEILLLFIYFSMILTSKISKTLEKAI